MKSRKNNYAFLSYNHLDMEIFIPVAGVLEEYINIWYDRELRTSDDLHENIAKAIDECRLFIIFLTPASINSGYVKKELSYAHQQRKKICAVVLRKCAIPKEIEDMLPKYKIHYVESEEAKFYEKLISKASRYDCDKLSKSVKGIVIAGIVIMLIIGIVTVISITQSKSDDIEIKNITYSTGDSITYYIKNNQISITSFDTELIKDEITVPSVIYGVKVTAIEYHAFAYTDYYIKSIVLSDGIETICDEAFDYNYRIESVTLPDSLISIGEYAFRECSGLTQIQIPESVTSIGQHAFEGCTITVSAPHEPDYYSYTPDEGVTWVITE